VLQWCLSLAMGQIPSYFQESMKIQLFFTKCSRQFSD